MSRLVVLAGFIALSACRISLEDGSAITPVDSSVDAPLSPSCMEALTHSDLAFIETKIFAPSCTFMGCHNGAATAAGRIDLRQTVNMVTTPGRTAPFLVNFDSALDPSRKLVVPGQPNQSFLLMMMQHIAPADMSPPAAAPDPQIGYMPQNVGGKPLCVEKRDAIQRWIMAGAPAT